MNNKRVMLNRLLRVILPMIVLLVLVIGSSAVKVQGAKANTDAVYAKATITGIIEDQSHGEAFSGTQRVTAVLTDGIYSGKSCTLDNANSYQRGALCTEGTKIIALVRENADGSITGSVYNYDRSGMLYILAVLFAAALLLIGGRKGAAALYALVFTFISVICMYIPLLYVGMNGVLAAFLTSLVILIVSIYIINGWSQKSICAMVGTAIGVIISGAVAMITGMLSHLDGFNMTSVESMIYISNISRLDVGSILYAGVLISSLGAVMDVSVSVVAAMKEIYDKVPDISAKELFRSGMRVGHDMMGTMSNTLILAYTGSATSVLITVYAYEMPYLQIMSYNSIIIEILCGLSGTLGVILTVPVQAFITSLFLKRMQMPKSAK